MGRGGGGRTNCQIWLVSTLACPEDGWRGTYQLSDLVSEYTNMPRGWGGGGGRTYQLSDLVSEYTKDLVSEYTKDLVSEYTNMPRGERGDGTLCTLWKRPHSGEGWLITELRGGGGGGVGGLKG